LDGLRKLCQRTISSSDKPLEQGIINQEADKRLLAAFINGLIGAVDKQIRMHMPDNINKALYIVATNAENEEKASGRDNRGTSTNVFTVGGSRGGIPENRYEKPRGRFQWSNNRGAWSQNMSGPTQYSTGVDGTYSRRTDGRTSMGNDSRARDIEGSAASGPRNDDDRCAPRRPCGIQCYNCGLFGHTKSGCPRGQRKNLNGVGRTKAAPPSYPK